MSFETHTCISPRTNIGAFFSCQVKAILVKICQICFGTHVYACAFENWAITLGYSSVLAGDYS